MKNVTPIVSRDMEEGMSKNEALEAIYNLYSLLLLPPPVHLNGRAKQVLKRFLDDALHHLLFDSSTEEAFNAPPPRITICSLHPDRAVATKQEHSEAAINATGQQRLVSLSDQSILTVSSSQRSDCPQPPVKRCRSCNTKQHVLNSAKPVPSSSSSTGSSMTTRSSQPRMQKTSPAVVAPSRPWPSVNNQLRRAADLATPAMSDTRDEVETTCRRETIRKQVLEESNLPGGGGLELSSDGAQDENVVHHLRGTVERENVSQNTESRPSEEHQYVHGSRVLPRMDGITKVPTMKGAKEKKQMPSPTGHSLTKAQSHKKHHGASTPIRPTMLNYEIPSSRKAQDHHLHSRSRTSNMKSQQRKSDTEEEWSSSARSRSYSPSSSSFVSCSRTSRQQTSTGSSSGSSNSENFSRSDYSPKESASESSSTVEDSNSGSSDASSSYRNTDGRRDGDSGSRSTRYRRSSREREVGRFKRFKDKLGSIFHHHHHHRHHDKSKHSKNGSKATTWKHARSMFHHEGKPQLYAEKAVVKKQGKLAVQKNHGQQFHALVQGLMHHVKNSRRSKTSKTSKVGRRRIGGVKLPNRRQVRVEFRGKKPQLKAATR